MAVTTIASGTQTAVIGTEHELDADTTANIFLFYVDTTNMVAGDITLLRIRQQILSSGALVTVYEAAYAHKQSEPVKISIPVASDYNISFRLQQMAGTGRNYNWSVKTL